MTSQSQTCAGQQMHDLAERLFPMHRAITGAGVRDTFAEIEKQIEMNK